MRGLKAWLKGFALMSTIPIMIAVGSLLNHFGEGVVEERVQRAVKKAVAAVTAKYVVERSERIAQLVREVRWDEFLDGVDPQDASIWTALVPYAELDEHCNALPECTRDTMHVARPITVTARSADGQLAYIAILGIEAWHPGGHVVIPRITYYVGSQGGALWRMPMGATLAEVRNPYTNEWRELHEQSASDWMLNEVRTAFITEWRRRLTETGAQEL